MAGGMHSGGWGVCMVVGGIHGGCAWWWVHGRGNA